jgi:hypothetical protein
MKLTAPSNELSNRTRRILSVPGFAIEKNAITRALQSGQLYPCCRPPNYGIYTHREVCHWAGVDPATLPNTWPDPHCTPYPDNGLSYRANNCLRFAGIAATREAVIQALKNGNLSPGKRPCNYGPVTHAELCQWADFTPPRPPPRL